MNANTTPIPRALLRWALGSSLLLVGLYSLYCAIYCAWASVAGETPARYRTCAYRFVFVALISVGLGSFVIWRFRPGRLLKSAGR